MTKENRIKLISFKNPLFGFADLCGSSFGVVGFWPIFYANFVE